MAEASLPEWRGDAETRPCSSVLELEELLRAGKFSSCSRVDEVWPNLYIGDAQGPGALCGGCQPLCHTGPGLPHAAPADVPAPGGDRCEAAPMGLPQPRLPPPALPAGPEVARWRPELRGQKQHQVCRDKRLEISTKCPSDKTTSWARYPHRSDPPRLLRQSQDLQTQLQTPILVPLTSKLCLVPDSVSQLTPETTHPSRLRPDWQRWPESRGMDSLQEQDLRRPNIHRAVGLTPYQPPTLSSLQRLLWVRRATMLSHIDEVWPNLFLGDAYAARDKSKLLQLGITHVVNVAAGKFQVDTGDKFYRGMPLEYYGVEADDNPFFDLSVHFLPVARYIRTALSVPQGRVLVHCAMGVSRSATVVLAFLMIYENMTLEEAIQTVQAHRAICPNSGFLRQLQVLDNRLGRETRRF
nr:PREDICTED: dual specificity protein phosphatase 13 isoform X4 [Rhinolophus sinicus]